LGSADLVARTDLVPTRLDRQLDVLESAPAGGGGGSAAPSPFDVIMGTPVMGVPNATFQPGTINGILPSNYASSFTLAASTTYFVTLDVTASAGQITSATLSFASSAPAAIPVNASSPPNSFSFMLGLLVTDALGGGEWFRTIGDGSLTAAGSLVYQVNAVSPAPGTLPFTNYYTWLMGLA
jgi:hypothetical protein